MTGFGKLYKKYAPDVYHFALYLSGERGEAEDITSETFVRVWASSEPVRVATVKGYLFTIARNLFLQGLRKKSRHVALDEDLRDPQASPYAQAEQKAELRAVLAGLQQLPEIDRAAVLMRAFDEMPYEEIARALGISLASAKVKIHRARLALADIRSAWRPGADSNDGREMP
jgi:RNA polymerase sigma-70 factor (ECF subfamily)